MAHAVADEPKAHMGLPLPHGKLAMWLFLVTEIMFFTGLIGTYILLRNGTPTGYEPWPTPHDVHLAEWMGAVNTFVLICSSLTVVLAHMALGKGDIRRATQLIALTLALGCVFLVIKTFEYKAKFEHAILPGHIYEKLDGVEGPKYIRHVREQLEHIVKEPAHAVGASSAAVTAWAEFLKTAKTKQDEAQAKKNAAEKKNLTPSATAEEKKAIDEATRKDLQKTLDKLTGQNKDIKPVAAAWTLLERLPGLSAKQLNLAVAGSKYVKHKKVDWPTSSEPSEVKGLLDEFPDLHVSYSIPYGNMWASCYFTLTGIHALHVLGGLVIFVIILLMAARGRFGPQHTALIEYTGLYWHFVDIVWIFLFPLLYLV